MQRTHSCLKRLLVVAVLWGSAHCACSSAEPGLPSANQNLNQNPNENQNQAPNENQNDDGSPCDHASMYIEGIPDRAVGPDSTIQLTAVMCDPQNGLDYQWTVTGPPDGAELSNPSAQETQFFVFNPGEFSVAVTAFDPRTGQTLVAEDTILAELGGPPFNE